MNRIHATALSCLAITAQSTTLAAQSAVPHQPSPQDQVELVVKADREQPQGWPVVIEVTMTNVGAEPVFWWCGRPDSYPSDEHFDVKVRYGGDPIDSATWHAVKATNGQYVAGSGGHRELKSRESIVVPLAVPVKNTEHAEVSIQTRTWNTLEPTTCSVMLRSERDCLDRRNARVIESVVSQSSPFWNHLAQKYADEVVIDAMLKLVTVDNAIIVRNAAVVLAQQETLPSSAGEAFGDLVSKWLNQSLPLQISDLQHWLIQAALRTQSESARGSVLKALVDASEERMQTTIIYLLKISPGDEAWLRRARDAIAGMRKPGSESEFASQVDSAVEWLESRIKSPQ